MKKNITFPKGDFTVNNIMKNLGDVTRATVQSRINKAVADGVVTVVGVKKAESLTGVGQPARVYRIA